MNRHDRWNRGLLAVWRESQHRTTFFLILNQAMGAAAGLLFWLLLARVAGLPAEEIGVGYAIVALGTAAGLVAKGGLDTALMRHAPGADHREARRLLRFGVAVGAAAAVALCLVLAAASAWGGALPEVRTAGWWLVGGIAVLLVVAWLQDAYFLAEGAAGATSGRNLVFSASKVVLPLPVVLLAVPAPVPITWILALAASAAAGVLLARGRGAHAGRPVVPRRVFLRSALRNVTGSAAEFLPGLLLVPLVLALHGARAAGHFGMAWTAASLLFLAAAAIGRSAFTQMVRGGPGAYAPAVRHAARQSLLILGPGIVAGILLARPVLGLFGADYAAAAGSAFVVLCASTVIVAPTYVYLAVLRAEERSRALVLFPAAMVVAIFALAPVLAGNAGITGVALAWLAANAPFGVWAAWRLRATAKEVRPRGTASFGRPSHLE